MSDRKARIAGAFDRAETYDAHAHVQRKVATRLAQRIAVAAPDTTQPALELGCGTGFLTAALLDALPGLALTATDIAPAMLDRARIRLGPRDGLSFARLDGEHPGPAPQGGWGLIASSLAFQWFEDQQAALACLCDRLAPNGLLAVSTLVTGSFGEWRAALEDAGLDGLVRDWTAPEALAALAPSGTTVALDCYELVETHKDARAFLASLKAIGAATSWQGRAAPGALRRAIATFEASGAQVTYKVAQLLIRRSGS